MRFMIRFLVGLSLVIAACTPAPAWTTPKADEAAPDTVRVVRWEGATDFDMLQQVRKDIEYVTGKDSKIKVLKVYLASPGGPVITSLEIARQIRKASDAGLTIEIHAEALCASGCTFVLASGTPGRRYIAKTALYLVHPIQIGGLLGSSCASYTPEPKTETEKVLNALLVLLRDAYIRFSGRPQSEVEDWLSCGRERVGGGELAVSMGLADAVED